MILRNLLLAVLFLLLGTASQAQTRYYSKTAKIAFFSSAPMEDIEAKNKAATVVLDMKSGALQITILMKGFEFEKALMQEHFNENYVESDKFPKADFKGTITNNAEVNYKKPGSYKAKVKGKLTMHGVTKDVVADGIIKVEGDAIKAESVFNIKLSDYKVKIPAVVKDKVANTIKITVESKLEPLK